jgi:purine-binding chemotaxis protein CheW
METEYNEEHSEYLAFESSGLRFVVNAMNIIEIITNHNTTKVPKVPDFVTGVINLRGQVIPIIDMSLRMGKSLSEYGEKSCIIVLEINEVMIGLLVETVFQVVNISADMINYPQAGEAEELTNGIVNIDKNVYLMLDCERLSKYV